MLYLIISIRKFLRAVKLVKMLNPLMDEASNDSDRG